MPPGRRSLGSLSQSAHLGQLTEVGWKPVRYGFGKVFFTDRFFFGKICDGTGCTQNAPNSTARKPKVACTTLEKRSLLGAKFGEGGMEWGAVVAVPALLAAPSLVASCCDDTLAGCNEPFGRFVSRETCGNELVGRHSPDFHIQIDAV